MSFPTTSILDNFNRADAGTLGANWTGPVFPRFGGSQLKIVSNTAQPAAVDFCEDYYNAASYTNDAESYVTISTLPSGESDEVRVFLNTVSGGSASVDCYEAYIQIHTAANEDCKLNRIDNDTVTQLGATDNSTNWASGDSVGIERIGTTITFYRKPSGGSWASLFSRTDATYNAGGNIGCGVYRTGALEDFGGGSIGAAPAPQAATMEQSHYRFYNNDGGEQTATAKANEDATATEATNVVLQLRVQLNVLADEPDKQDFVLEYKKLGEVDNQYRRVT